MPWLPLLLIGLALVGLWLVTKWTDRKGWTRFYRVSGWRGAAMYANGWDQYFRPSLKAAEEYKIEIHDEEDGEGDDKDPEGKRSMRRPE
ncbi:MAG: hypothetical protein K0R39_3233 [Symbiobacteriaceae bacterium]|jgi:hypothetical protein|nr:hypothetical protein [Symbiobacteriaceae bacterium]